MVNVGRALTVALLLIGLGGCDSPTEPITPSPTPAPVQTPAPAPTPAPTPVPTPEPAEPPVENTAPAARVTIRLYTLEDGNGNFISNPDPNDVIPSRYWARLDVTSKDAKNRETNGQGSVDFLFSNPRYLEIVGGHTHQRRVRAFQPTTTDCWATQDGVKSNVITLTFK